MPLEQLTLTTEEAPKQVTVIAVKGYLDSHTFDQLQQALADLFDKGVFKIVLDMKELNYMSSAGAGVLIGAMSQATTNEGGLVLASMGPAVMDVFKELGLADVFKIAPDRDAALAMF
jgi:anti-sigma B factor antagonist